MVNVKKVNLHINFVRNHLLYVSFSKSLRDLKLNFFLSLGQVSEKQHTCKLGRLCRKICYMHLKVFCFCENNYLREKKLAA